MLSCARVRMLPGDAVCVTVQWDDGDEVVGDKIVLFGLQVGQIHPTHSHLNCGLGLADQLALSDQ